MVGRAVDQVPDGVGVTAQRPPQDRRLCRHNRKSEESSLHFLQRAACEGGRNVPYES